MSLPTLMVLDRDDRTAAVTACALKPHAKRVQTFNDPDAAVDLFARNPGTYDMVVIDAVLCSVSGAEVAREMRALRGDVAIVLTAPASVLGFLDALEDKPFNCAATKAQLWEAPHEILRKAA